MQITITREQACSFLLAYHHLKTPRSLEGKEGILKYISRVGAIQFDPLNIVGRSPDLLLHSRVAGYSPQLLDDLLYNERKLLDGYDKEMCIYPVHYWPFFKRRRADHRVYMENNPRFKPVIAEHQKILDEITRRGALSSKDITLDKTVDWHWAPTSLSRAVLENLYHKGELVVHHREKNRKFYDLARKVLPEEIFERDEPFPDDESYFEWYVHRRIGSVGLLWLKSGSAWLGTCKSAERKAAVERLINKKLLKEVTVKGLSLPFYVRSDDFPLLLETISAKEDTPGAAIMAPLDNMLWDRDMIETLFGFFYRWEVYKPAAQRLYGYYVLPVLYGNRFVGRFEPGLDKGQVKGKGKSKRLVIKNWWCEDNLKINREMKKSIKTCFEDFTAFLKTPDLEVTSEAREGGCPLK